MVNSPLPAYPSGARGAEFQGVVRLCVRVGVDGRPMQVDLERGSGRTDCDQSARETVERAWRFRAATIDGHAVESSVVVAVRFSLDS